MSLCRQVPTARARNRSAAGSYVKRHLVTFATNGKEAERFEVRKGDRWGHATPPESLSLSHKQASSKVAQTQGSGEVSRQKIDVLAHEPPQPERFAPHDGEAPIGETGLFSRLE